MLVRSIYTAILVTNTLSSILASQVPESIQNKSHKRSYAVDNLLEPSSSPKQRAFKTQYTTKELSKIIKILLMQLLPQTSEQKSDDEIRRELSNLLQLLKDFEPDEILGLSDITPEKTEETFKILLRKLHNLTAGDYERFPEARELRKMFINAYNQLQSIFTHVAVLQQSSRPFLGDPKLLKPRI